jgi:hypothetical protein
MQQGTYCCCMSTEGRSRAVLDQDPPPPIDELGEDRPILDEDPPHPPPQQRTTAEKP